MEKKYFMGNEVSEYGVEHGYVDYACLAKAFDAVLNNSIMQTLESAGYYFEMVNGFVDNQDEIENLNERIAEFEDEKDRYLEHMYLLEEHNKPADDTEYKIKDIEYQIDELEDDIKELEDEENYPPEIFQYFIIDNNAVNILQEYTNEIIYSCEELDLHIWGVTHYGTSWRYVLTDIPVERGC